MMTWMYEERAHDWRGAWFQCPLDASGAVTPVGIANQHRCLTQNFCKAKEQMTGLGRNLLRGDAQAPIFFAF